MMLSRNNILIVALLAAQLCFLIIVSPKKAFWRDEVLTYEVINKSSFSEMWHATTDTLNSSPPLYFVALWLWKQVAGTDPLALRLFTTLCMMGTAFIWWLLLTKAYSKESASLGVIFCFSLSAILQFHLAEARQYALYSFFMSVVCYSAYSVWSCRKHYKRYLVLFVFSNMALIFTHYYGILYSAGLTATGMLVLIRDRKIALLYFLAASIGWLSFLPWLPTMKLHYEVASQCPWYAKPMQWNLYEILTSQGSAMEIFLVLILLCLGSSRFSRVPHNPSANVALGSKPAPDKPTLLPIAGLMVGIVLVLFLYSILVKPLFNPRYLICSYPCIAIFITHISYRYLTMNASHDSGIPLHTKILLHATSLAMLCYLVLSAWHVPAEREYHVILNTVSQESLPVIDEFPYEQLPLWYYSSSPKRIVFLLNTADYGCNIGPQRILADIVKYADGMTAVTIEEFLKTNSEFYLIDRPEIDWGNKLILDSHDYRCVLLLKGAKSLSIYHVKKMK